MIAPFDLDASVQRVVLQRSAEFAERWMRLGSLEIREMVRSVVDVVTVQDATITLQLNRRALAARLAPDVSSAVTTVVEPIVLSIHASLRRAGQGVRLIIGDGAANTVEIGLVDLINKAFEIRRALLSGAHDSIDSMAQRIGIRREYLTGFVRLSYVSPTIVRAILAGHQPIELSPKWLMLLSKDLPHDWQEQHHHLGFTSP